MLCYIKWPKNYVYWIFFILCFFKCAGCLESVGQNLHMGNDYIANNKQKSTYEDVSYLVQSKSAGLYCSCDPLYSCQDFQCSKIRFVHFRVSELISPSSLHATVANTAVTRSNCSTLPTFLSFCNLLWFQISTSFHR